MGKTVTPRHLHSVRALTDCEESPRTMPDPHSHDQFLHDFLTHRRMLHAFILSLTGDYAVAEDIFQEVSTVLWRKYEKYQQGTNFGAWAREVAYREVLSTRKKLARGSSRAFVLCDDATMENILAAYRRADERDERAGMGEDERLEALRCCLDAVGGPGSQMLRMRYEEKMSSRSIASQLGRTVGAVDVALHRIRARLADCVQARLAREGT